MTMDYALRVPELDELRKAFGSVAAAVRVTGGDIVSACYLIANPHRVAGAGVATRLCPDCPREWVTTAAAETFAETQSVVEVASRLHVAYDRARELLEIPQAMTAWEWKRRRLPA